MTAPGKISRPRPGGVIVLDDPPLRRRVFAGVAWRHCIGVRLSRGPASLPARRASFFAGGIRQRLPDWNEAENTAILRPACVIRGAQASDRQAVAVYQVPRTE